jgi:hypothetical protein
MVTSLPPEMRHKDPAIAQLEQVPLAMLRRRWAKRVTQRGYLLAVAAPILMYGPFLIAHIHNSANPYIFEDDSRAWIAPFVVSDYASDYYSTLLPIGYKAFYQIVALVADPIAASKVVPYPLLLAVIGGVWVAAGRLGGVAASFCTAALCLSTGIFLDSMVGGTPRVFGFPLIAAAAVALVLGRTLWLAAIVVVSSALYPPVALVTGLALGFETLALSARHREDTREWSLRRRIMLVSATALCSALVLAPLITEKDYGPRLTLQDLAAYPEAGPGGRYSKTDSPPFQDLWTEFHHTALETLKGTGQPWSHSLQSLAEERGLRVRLALGGVTALGLAILATRNSAARRLLMLGAGAAAAHTAARLLAPYLISPSRYVLYPIPILIVIGLPVAAGVLPTLFRRLAAVPWMRPLASLAITAACLVLLGGRGSEWTGLIRDYRQDASIFEFLERLPNGTLVAGWPDDVGIVDSVPYLSRHPAFLTYETHQAFHRGYLDEMRRRMRGLIDAVFAIDAAPLVHLRDDWGVTHLIIDERYYGPSPPTYFKPFDAWIHAAVERGRITGFEVPRQIEAATVFSQGSLAVLDLRKLTGPKRQIEDSSQIRH